MDLDKEKKLNDMTNELNCRLETFDNLSTIPQESKGDVWLRYLSVWHDILQISPNKIPLIWNRCLQLIPILIKSTNFYEIRKDVNIARQSCFSCIEQLNQSYMKKYFILSKEEKELEENVIYSKHISNLLLISSGTASFIPFSTNEDQLFIQNHIPLFRILIEYVQNSMPQQYSISTDKNLDLGLINRRILSLFWNLSDRTVLIPILIECHLAERVVNWLSQSSLLTENSRRPFISIVHNIARHDNGADQLNQFNAIQFIQSYQKLLVDFDSFSLQIFFKSLEN